MTVEKDNKLVDISHLVKNSNKDGFRTDKTPTKKQLATEIVSKVDTLEKVIEAVRQGLNNLNKKVAQVNNVVAQFQDVSNVKITGMAKCLVKNQVVTEQDIADNYEAVRVEILEDRDKFKDLQAGLVVVDRPAKSGDIVLVDFKGEIEGQALPEFADSFVNMVVCGGGTIDDFDKKLEGMEAGKTYKIDMKMPTENADARFAGKTVNFEAVCRAVKELKKEEKPCEGCSGNCEKCNKKEE